MTDLLTKVKEALEAYEGDHTQRYRLSVLAPDMARALIAAGELAETHKAMLRMLDDVIKGTGAGDMAITPNHSLTLVDAWKRQAAFRAAMEGRTDD